MIDLDGDGKLDIAASNTAASNCRFATFRNISTPGNLAFEPVEIWFGLTYSGFTSRVIDLDGDGRAELLGQHGSSSVFIDFWIAQNISTPGNIEFGSSVDFTFGNSIDAGAGVGAGDLDNDGKPELLVSDGFGARFHILKNNSTPSTISFSQVGVINTGQYNGSLQTADFNLDGKNDLLWKRTGGPIYIRLNSNSGGALDITDFTTEVLLTGDLGANGGITINDINGDGKPDIVSSDNSDIGVFENIYSGSVFDASAFIPAYEISGAGSSATTAFASDLNGDAKPDLIFGATPTRLSIFENKNIHTPVISVNTVSPLKGDIGSTVTITGNNFSPVLSENQVWFGGVEATVLTATENLITAEVPAGATNALVSVTKEGLTSRYRLPFQTTFGPGVTFDNTHFAPPVNFTLTSANYYIDAGDLDRDGKPDLLAQGSGAYAFRNNHTTGPITTSSLIPDDTLSGLLSPRLEDLDGDGYLDVMSVNGPLRKNNSTSSEISFLPQITVPLGASIVDFADFNNDGKTDMTLTTDLSGPGDLIILENRTTSIPGNFVTGTYGSFSSNIIYNKPFAGGAVITGDFDGDGFADIVALNPGTDNISIYKNLGVLKISTAQFATRIDVAVGDYPAYIYKGDFDSDGKLDLMLTHWTGTSSTLIIVLHNTSTPGNISFSRIDLTNPTTATMAHVADLDGDGKPEILTTAEANNQFFIFKNLHTSGALTTASFGVPFSTAVTAPRAIATADINLDGKPEIILTRAAGFLLVYENLISSGPTISITSQPTSTAVCNGSNASLSLTASGTTNLTYQWQMFDGSVFNNVADGGGYSGATTAALGINTTGNFGAGDYRCLIKGDLAPDKFSNTVTLTVNVVPAAPTGNGNSNCIPAAITLTASGGSNGQYRWYDVATGGTAISGQVNSSYTTPVITTTTTYHVAINNGFCESSRTPVIATIAPIAKPTLTSSVQALGGTINLCTGDVLTINAPSGFTNYIWSNGGNTNPITINSSTSSLTLQVVDGAGCTSPVSDALNIVVNPYPVATITPTGTQLTASAGDSYQWYQNGDVVVGATNQNFDFNFLEYGLYVVDVTDNGCTSTSLPFEYLITGFEKNTEGLKVYPNPVEENLFVEFKPPYTIQVMGVTGNVIQNLNAQSTPSSIDFSSMAKGIYFLKIKNENQTQYLRIIKK
ncbi:MAG TPA: FG-GAP-like repeat-containing protein [Chryseolinea sp.]|nr:FG-GAP-like repeat-containing protein [Chryseolinea sp.]